jgi:hypothetical protein
VTEAATIPASILDNLPHRPPDGILAHCDCGFGTAEIRFYKIVCERGVIELESTDPMARSKCRSAR